MWKWISSWTLAWSIGSMTVLNFYIWFRLENLSVIPAAEWLYLWWWFLLLLISGDLKLKLWAVFCFVLCMLCVSHLPCYLFNDVGSSSSLSHFRINYFCCHLDFSHSQIHLVAVSNLSSHMQTYLIIYAYMHLSPSVSLSSVSLSIYVYIYYVYTMCIYKYILSIA